MQQSVHKILVRGGVNVLFRDRIVRQTETISGMEAGVIPSGAWNSLRESLQLSRREVEIIQLVFADEKDGNIAGNLGISRHTVDTYLRRLYAKLQVSSRPQLILRVVAEYLHREPEKANVVLESL